MATDNMKLDAIKTLGLKLGCSEKDAKDAFRKLSLKYHPDKNSSPSATSQYQKILEAYEFIKANPAILLQKSRAHEDTPKYGQTKPEDTGSDCSTRVVVDSISLFNCDSVIVTYTIKAPCSTCSGSGSSVGASRICGLCGGSGNLEGPLVSSMGFGGACPECKGTGTDTPVDKLCKKCEGSSLQKTRECLSIKLSPKYRDKDVITIRGKGSYGRWGGPRGDLFLRIDIESLDTCRIHGDTLRVSVPVTPAQVMTSQEVVVDLGSLGKASKSFNKGMEPVDLILGVKKVRLVPEIFWPSLNKDSEELYMKLLELEKLSD